MTSFARLSVSLSAFLLVASPLRARAEEVKTPAAEQPKAQQAVVEQGNPSPMPAEQPKADAVTPPAAAPVAPAEQPAAAPEEKAACPVCPAEQAKEPSAVLLGCSKALETISAGLKDAYHGFLKWTAEASSQIESLEKKDGELQTKLVDTDTQIAKLRAASAKTNKKQIKELTAESKQLAKEIDLLRKEKATLCSSISRTTAQKVRELTADIKGRLGKAQQELKQ